MTIEIKQLIIRAVVEEPRERAPGVGAGAGSPRRQVAPGPSPRTARPPDVAMSHEALIAECTRQVLRALRRGQGR